MRETGDLKRAERNREIAARFSGIADAAAGKPPSRRTKRAVVGDRPLI